MSQKSKEPSESYESALTDYEVEREMWIYKAALGLSSRRAATTGDGGLDRIYGKIKTWLKERGKNPKLAFFCLKQAFIDGVSQPLSFRLAEAQKCYTFLCKRLDLIEPEKAEEPPPPPSPKTEPVQKKETEDKPKPPIVGASPSKQK